ncbi:hypothetical protein HYFRA_00004989 [Hymenoscyphus fraxineus]|uniref:Uncharacterized protein n=1 Tax=Hymenoscyphus fraxineus TaxID=746836 RepID=A0A9N9KPQ4_9HELO|nr:hypothetical protein HYFRA_00004989 [Hymenoscyphus fraxineus]
MWLPSTSSQCHYQEGSRGRFGISTRGLDRVQPLEWEGGDGLVDECSVSLYLRPNSPEAGHITMLIVSIVQMVLGVVSHNPFRHFSHTSGRWETRRKRVTAGKAHLWERAEETCSDAANENSGARALNLVDVRLVGIESSEPVTARTSKALLYLYSVLSVLYTNRSKAIMPPPAPAPVHPAASATSSQPPSPPPSGRL